MEKNNEKYEAYKAMKMNLNKAMKSGFYYQAIFIEYAIIEDRCLSALKHAGVKYVDSCYLSSKYAHFLWNKNVQIIRSS